MLHKLIFDTTDAASQDDSANVGAYLRGGNDGSLVNVTSNALDVNIGAVSDLDIRDLVFATDKVDVSGSEVSLDAATLAALETITVIATDLDIRDLAAATDSVSAWTKDGTGTAITSTGGALDINIASGDLDDSLANTAMATGSTTIPTTAGGTDLRATDLANRKWLIAYNNGNKEVFIGNTGVSSATGFPLPPGSALELRAGAAIDVFAISSAGSQDIRTLELS